MHLLVLKLTLNQLKKKPFSRLVLVLSMAAILTMNGFLAIVMKSIYGATKEVQAGRYMTAYIDNSISESQEGELVSAIKKTKGIGSAELVSRGVFLKRLEAVMPGVASEVAGVESDSLPRYVKIRALTRTESNAAAVPTIESLRKSIESIRGIETVETFTQRYEGIFRALDRLNRLVFGLFVGLSLALICVLVNHFKLSNQLGVQFKRAMNLLGAKSSYTALPFLLEGLVEGTFAGAIAGILVLSLGQLMLVEMSQLSSSLGYMPQSFVVWPVAALIAVLGGILGVMGSLWVMIRVKQ